MNEPQVEAIDMSRWIDDMLDLSDEFVAAVERRAHLESQPFPRAMFAVAASAVVNFRLCQTGPNKDAKLAAMLTVTTMLDPLMADLKEACAERAAKAH